MRDWCCPKAQSFWLLQGCRAYLSSWRVIELENSDLTVASREINRCRQFHTCLWSHGVVLLSCRAVAARWGAMCSPSLVCSWHSGGNVDFRTAMSLSSFTHSLFCVFKVMLRVRWVLPFPLIVLAFFLLHFFFHQFFLFLCVSVCLTG